MRTKTIEFSNKFSKVNTSAPGTIFISKLDRKPNKKSYRMKKMFTSILLMILSSFIVIQSLLIIPAKSVYANAENNLGTALMPNKQASPLTEQNSPIILQIADTNTSITNINITNKTISDQYIITLKNDLIRTPKALEDALGNLTAKVQSEGARVIYIYNYSIKGIAIKIPNQQILEKLFKDLRNDSRVANIEPDKTVKAF
jgi:hypothetical protein